MSCGQSEWKIWTELNWSEEKTARDAPTRQEQMNEFGEDIYKKNKTKTKQDEFVAGLSGLAE